VPVVIDLPDAPDLTMTSTVSQALQQIAAHPRCNEMARLTRDTLFDAVGNTNLDLATTVTERATAANLSQPDATVGQQNVLDALSRPTKGPDEALLLGSLLAYALALDPGQAESISKNLVWLATHAGVDAFHAIDDAMGDAASAVWNALADLLKQHDETNAGITRAEAIVAASALATSQNATAQRRREELSQARTPTLARLLRAPVRPAMRGMDAALAGELAPPPRGPAATFFLGLSGWLLVSHLARTFGRFALQYRRPTEVRLTPQGIQVKSTTKMLGKVMRESETLIPLEGLARATREVRFPRLGTYAGLVALAIGSYVGVSWFIDGIRSGSFSLATVGLLVVLGGVALDFALMSWLPGRKGRCRLVLVPRRGSTTCVGWVDAAQADAMLKAISGGTSS
jgi:hypothetical protein